MENIVLLILGVFISVMVGTGTLIIGVSLVLGFIVSFWSEEMIAYITHPAVVVGLGFMLYGQFKYNKGIF